VGVERQPLAASDHTSGEWAAREAVIARIAAGQHEQITTAQLLDAGLSETAIRNRVRTRRLYRVHRGVLSVGRPPVRSEEHWMAAVLACGESAALSHASGAANLGIRASAATIVDVTSPTGRGRRLPGIRVHRSRLEPWEVTVVNGIPTTTCARTLLDLAEVLHPGALSKALDQAEIERLLDLVDLRRVLAHNQGRCGVRPLRTLLASLDPQTKRTRNHFERALYMLCEKASLPLPEPSRWLNLEGRWIEADFLWPDARLVLETDGFETHSTRQAFERDRAKDALLLRAGYRVIRVTWRQLVREPSIVAATIRAGLARPG
jgi:very-short-patch-repair endonuclease/predicted transcriptional regulator of viral defense system